MLVRVKDDVMLFIHLSEHGCFHFGRFCDKKDDVKQNNCRFTRSFSYAKTTTDGQNENRRGSDRTAGKFETVRLNSTEVLSRRGLQEPNTLDVLISKTKLLNIDRPRDFQKYPDCAIQSESGQRHF